MDNVAKRVVHRKGAGPPLTAINPEKIAAVKKVVEEDNRISYAMMCRVQYDDWIIPSEMDIVRSFIYIFRLWKSFMNTMRSCLAHGSVGLHLLIPPSSCWLLYYY